MPSAIPVSNDLSGLNVLLSRPAGSASSLAAQVRRRGGSPLLLPGLSLRPALETTATRNALLAALRGDDLLIFGSPAAVRYAASLAPLRSGAVVLAVGQATAAALRRRGLTQASAPTQADSEGLLASPALAEVAGRRVALIGAAGGRGVLRERLAAAGACLREVHVYRRQPSRLDRRHVQALLGLDGPSALLLSSADALAGLQRGLPPPAWRVVQGTVAVVSSERLAEAARTAGIAQIVRAKSALSRDLLAAAANLPR